jgi:hypothetical protein
VELARARRHQCPRAGPGGLPPWFPLDRLQEALEAMRTRPDGFLKALVLT